MAKGQGKSGGGGDGSHVPSESVILDGEIITAAVSTFGDRDLSKGYSEPPNRMRMEILSGRKK